MALNIMGSSKTNPTKTDLNTTGKAHARLLLGVLVLTMTLPLGCSFKPQANGTNGTDQKILHYFRNTNYKSLDPPRQFDTASMTIVTNVYDSLFDFHYLKRPYEIEPNLLTKMPDQAADKVTYTFTLRKGIMFHDDPCFEGGKGRELTADDVLYTIKRFADVNINTNSYPVLLKGRIKGLDALHEQSRQEKNLNHAQVEVEGLKKIDRHTFQIILSQPDPLFLMSLASGALGILPQEAVDYYGQKLEHHAVGTGPFILAQNPRRGEIILKKNPTYHGLYPSAGEPEDESNGLLEDAKQPLPFVDEVRLPLIEEEQPRMLKFLKGEIDWIGFDRNNFVKMAEKNDQGFQLKDEFAGKYQIYSSESLSSSYFKLNMKDKVLGQNKALRQAIAYAIDTPAFIDKMLNGRGVPLNTIVPLPIIGSENSVDAQWYQTNLEKAKQKLTEAGYPDGKGLAPITLEYRLASTQTRQNYEFLRAQLAKVGIQTKANFQTFSTYLRKVDAGNFQMADSGWTADYPDAENFYQLLYGPNKAPGPNASAYQNPEYDQLYEQIRQMPPGPERNQIMAKMSAILKEDVPIILGENPISVGMYQKWVGNMKRNQMMVGQFKFLDIDVEAKAKGITP